MTLREALEARLHDQVLLDDGADKWTPRNLLDALSEDDLTQEVYSCEDYISQLDEQGYKINPPLFRIKQYEAVEE